MALNQNRTINDTSLTLCYADPCTKKPPNQRSNLVDICSKLKLGLALSLSALTLSFSAVSQAEPAMLLTTINTQDGAGYVAWFKASAKAIAKSANAGSMGLCSPFAGAEQMGDHYIVRFFDSQKALWAADPMDPIMVKEIAKINVKRTVKEQDHWAVVRAQPTNGDIYSYFLHEGQINRPAQPTMT